MIYSAALTFHIYEAQNLKEKRAVLQRVLMRARQKFNVSMAEIGFLDKWQRTEIGFVIVGSSRVQTEKEGQEVLRFLDSFPEWERLLTDIEWL
ncbi:DUF503 domain-containing protein [Listeria sp. ILCC804]|uniref:DUF503 domain-containing protein n=1 Tax=Listeria TaxID=1637 RepID=UPI0035130A5D